MIQDLLVAEGSVFVTEDDIMTSADLMGLLDGKTPDLIVKSNKAVGRLRPTILDIYVGNNEARMNDKKAKYKSMQVAFDFSVITHMNYCSSLAKILSSRSVDYLHKQFCVFEAEYAYWRACMKAKKLLFNDIVNDPIIELQGRTPQYVQETTDFKVMLAKKAAALLDTDGV
jgi:hypothetical protein